MEPSDTELIAAVRKGDVAQFEPLIARYQPRVFATARRYARREDEIQDIVQEVFIKAFQKLDSFRAEAPFEHWLMRMAVRTCYDFLRSHQRQPNAKPNDSHRNARDQFNVQFPGGFAFGLGDFPFGRTNADGKGERNFSIERSIGE